LKTLHQGPVYWQNTAYHSGFKTVISRFFLVQAKVIFYKNTMVIGIDFDDIDAVILSHGHYDHT